MLTYIEIDPIAFQLGPIAIRWYGIMYVLGLLAAGWICLYLGQRKEKPFTTEEVLDLLFYCALGVIFGGTAGYLIFYEPSYLLQDPLAILKFWLPGRSFHGGLLGVIIAIFVYCKRYRRRFLEVSDLLAPAVPIGLGLGRLGNFINAELWGRVSDVPWAMVFPNAGNLPRHPSQLYEFFFEGIVLFIVLFSIALKPQKQGKLTAIFMILYGLFRSFVEFFREPDTTQGLFMQGFLTKGQLLSIPMIAVGLGILYYVHTQKIKRPVGN